MKPKLAPRHIIPTVCYALLLVGYILIALLAFQYEFIDTENLQGSGFAGLIILGFAVAIKGILLIIGIGGALVTLPPLVLSSINIAWRRRIPAIACLIYDISWCQVYLGCLFAVFPDFTSFTPLIVGIPGLFLCALPLAMNIRNIMHNHPIPTPEATEESVT